MAMRRELAEELEPLRENALDGHPWQSWATAGGAGDGSAKPSRKPGAQSRWSQGKDLSWVPVRPEGVLEVKFDTMQSGRFRHAATFLRWRSDKAPEECTVDQIDTPAPADVTELWRSR